MSIAQQAKSKYAQSQKVMLTSTPTNISYGCIRVRYVLFGSKSVEVAGSTCVTLTIVDATYPDHRGCTSDWQKLLHMRLFLVPNP